MTRGFSLWVTGSGRPEQPKDLAGRESRRAHESAKSQGVLAPDLSRAPGVAKDKIARDPARYSELVGEGNCTERLKPGAI
jgi:hypothetical protein